MASTASLASFHLAVDQVQRYQARERALMDSAAQPDAGAARPFALAPGQAAAPDGLAQLRAALQ